MLIWKSSGFVMCLFNNFLRISPIAAEIKMVNLGPSNLLNDFSHSFNVLSCFGVLREKNVSFLLFYTGSHYVARVDYKS